MSLSKRQKRLRNRGPRRLRMTRSQRLQSARATNWVTNYGGKNLVRGYCRWFGVELLCAVVELRMLGVKIDGDREAQIRRTVENLAETRKRRKQAREGADSNGAFGECDSTFGYIAGYTPGSVPFGVTWEELDEEPRGRTAE